MTELNPLSNEIPEPPMSIVDQYLRLHQQSGIDIGGILNFFDEEIPVDRYTEISALTVRLFAAGTAYLRNYDNTFASLAAVGDRLWQQDNIFLRVGNYIDPTSEIPPHMRHLITRNYTLREGVAQTMSVRVPSPSVVPVDYTVLLIHLPFTFLSQTLDEPLEALAHTSSVLSQARDLFYEQHNYSSIVDRARHFRARIYQASQKDPNFRNQTLTTQQEAFIADYGSMSQKDINYIPPYPFDRHPSLVFEN